MKRGWAEPEGQLDRTRTKTRKENREKRTGKQKERNQVKTVSGTGKAECLFKTSLTPTAKTDKALASSEASDRRSKKRKRTEALCRAMNSVGQ